MSRRCRFCKSEGLELAFAKTSRKTYRAVRSFACTNSYFGLHKDILHCQRCGIYYVDEKISQQQVSTYYEVARDKEYFREQPARAKTFRHYLRRLDRQFPQKGKLLDIGTNTGLFVKLARDAGWEAVGLEPNRWAVKYAWDHYKIKLIAKPFEANIAPFESFDVITMWDVIEHFTNPIAEMGKVYRFLRPGGLFAFSTVDPDSLLAKIMGTRWSWFMEMHKVFFPRAAARFFLTRAGFHQLEFYPHWRFLSLGYLATRLAAINAKMAKAVQKLVKGVGLSRVVIPYYANDLYDCYATK